MKSVVVALLALLAACASPEAPVDSAEGKRPNVLLIVVDTLRPDRLGCYGGPRDTSPAIDGLASAGMRLTEARVPTGWTSPSMATIMTGLFPSSHTVTTLERVLPHEVQTLAEILSDRGWSTAGVVSNKHLGRKHNFDQGFDVYLTSEAQGHEHVSTPGVTRQAIDELNRMEADDAPFFLFVHYFDPHYTYLRHPEFGFAPERAGRLAGGEPMNRLKRMVEGMTQEEVDFLLALYDEEIRFTDAGIGALLRRLQRLGRDDDTIVMLTADHGEEFLEHGFLGHTRTLYDELVRVPWIVRAPGIAPQVVDRPVSLVSLPATVMQLVGIDPATFDFQGPSLMDAVDEPVFCEVDFVPIRPGRSVVEAHARALVDGRMKLVHDRASGTWELYDLESDPGERSDLSSERVDDLRALKATLERLDREAASRRFELELRTFDEAEIERLRGLGYVGD